MLRGLLLASLTTLVANSALGADISLTQHHKVTVLRIEGQIVPGDYDRFVKTVLQGSPEVGRVALRSRGGDALEAMKIGRLIRKLSMRTSAPTSFPDDIPGAYGGFCHGPDATKDPADCTCQSACFLMWVAGVERSGGLVGIHRSYVPHDLLKQLTATEAAELTKTLSAEVAGYLVQMNVPIAIIQRIERIPSGQIEYLDEGEVQNYFAGFIPELDEWMTAQCGDPTELTKEATELSAKGIKFKLGLGPKRTPSEIARTESVFKELTSIRQCMDQKLFELRQSTFRELAVQAKPARQSAR